MKKIVLTITAILLLAPSVTRAHGYYPSYSSVRYRAHWSIHVQDLVPGDVYYTPYAFDHGHSGLVRDDVRYSPYAFRHGHSGLITEDGHSYRPDYSPDGRIIYVVGYSLDSRPSCVSSQTPDFKGMMERREMMVRARKEDSKKINTEKERQRQKIAAISEFLKGKNMGDFEVRYGRISIAGQRDAYFISRDSGNRLSMVIRYSDIGSKSPHYKGYEKEWQDFCRECKDKLGDTVRIHEIKAANEEGIKAQLRELFAS